MSQSSLFCSGLSIMTWWPLFWPADLYVWIFQDLEGKIVVDELRQEVLSTNSKAQAPQCISLAWSADGQTLFAGYTDNLIRVWQVSMAAR